jgi:hypothetical protein
VKVAEIGRETIGGIGIVTTIMTKIKAGIDIRIAITVAEMGRETIGGTGIDTMIVLKRKAGIGIDIRIAIIAITTITVMTEEVVPASTLSTRRVTGVPTKKEANRIAAARTIRRTMKDTDGNAETKTKMKLEDVITNVAKTMTKNDIESTTNITSGIGRRRATPLEKEETTIAAIKSGIVVVEVEARLA